MIQGFFKRNGLTILKGMAMGAADVVPGVSGGTIAFITGIYEKLISSINSVDFSLIAYFKQEGISKTWNKVNGNFLAALFSGILISVLSLAKLISYLLKEHTIVLWSFFFGLILASIIYVGKSIKKWDFSVLLAIIIGTAVAYSITILPPSNEPDSKLFIFFSGMVAICAMILPGISGSFILLLLGAYETIINSIKELNVLVLAIFGLGCISGLLSFSKLLNWMFKHHHNTTIAVLTGFLIGSLNKIWPWKETLTFRKNSHGELVPFIESNISPSAFESINQESNLLVWAIISAVIGFSMIFLVEGIASIKKK